MFMYVQGCGFTHRLPCAYPRLLSVYAGPPPPVRHTGAFRMRGVSRLRWQSQFLCARPWVHAPPPAVYSHAATVFVLPRSMYWCCMYVLYVCIVCMRTTWPSRKELDAIPFFFFPSLSLYIQVCRSIFLLHIYIDDDLQMLGDCD